MLSRAALFVAGVRFHFALDWMWTADPADLRERLVETLFYLHAFPPGMNGIAGVLLKAGGDNPALLAHLLFICLGLVSVNALFYLFRATGASSVWAAVTALVFALTPPAIYFEHLFHYEALVIALLLGAAVTFHGAVRRSSPAAWFVFFSLCAAVALTRSTFHLIWYVATAALAVSVIDARVRRALVVPAIVPGLLLVAVYAKNAVLFGEFAASTFGPANFTLVTVAQLPPAVRRDWIDDGVLSPFAAISVYEPPRAYARLFTTPAHPGWPPQVTRLEHTAVRAPNYNHWWVLEAQRLREQDGIEYVRRRPMEYAGTVLRGLRDMFGPSTRWHPRDETASPHLQHRQVLGRYEAWYNRLVHGFPIRPLGLYALLPIVIGWTVSRVRRLARSGDTDERARGALLLLCVFQVVYVVAVSTMVAYQESARYRYQVEWAIWVMTAYAAAAALASWRRHRTPHRWR